MKTFCSVSTISNMISFAFKYFCYKYENYKGVELSAGDCNSILSFIKYSTQCTYQLNKAECKRCEAQNVFKP